LLVGELEALETALHKPARPLVAIVGGSKVSTKLTVLESLLEKVDKLIVGGGMQYVPRGHGRGCRQVVARGRDARCGAPLDGKGQGAGHGNSTPTDVVVAKEFAATAHADVRTIHDVRNDEMILDIGPDTADRFSELVQSAGTIIWNGPLGVFEFEQFGEGTRAIAHAIAAQQGVFARRWRRHAGCH